MKNVTVFSTPTCSYCKMAKEFFTLHGVAFEEKDVYHDEVARAEMFEKTGQGAVPVIKIGEEYVVGYNEQLLAEKLGIAL